MQCLAVRRRELGLLQANIARRLDRDQSAVSRLERRPVNRVQTRTREAYLAALDAEIEARREADRGFAEGLLTAAEIILAGAAE